MNEFEDCLDCDALEHLTLDESPLNSSAGALKLTVSSKLHHFDVVIGHIEDLLMDHEFKDTLDEFMSKYWREFERSDENKLSYTNIFKEYTDIVEQRIETYLNKMMPDFSMAIFIQELQEQKNDLDGEVFEILFTISNFEAFKDMFLDYKDVKEGVGEDLGKCLTVTSMALDYSL